MNIKWIVEFVKHHAEIIVCIIILLVIFFYVRNRMKTAEKEGIVTIAKVIKFEGAESGSDLYVDIFFGDKVYSTSLGYGCGTDCVGKYFFVRVLKNKPAHYPVFYGDRPVPDCILNNVKYFEGWKDIPNCDNYR